MKPKVRRLKSGLTLTFLMDGSVKLYATAKRIPRYMGARHFYLNRSEVGPVGAMLVSRELRKRELPNTKLSGGWGEPST